MTGDGSMDIRHIDAVAPWFELTLLRDHRVLDRLPSPRIFKTHLTIARLPQTAKCIYLIRNPKDSCVSYYHHLTAAGGFDVTYKTFVHQFVRGQLPWGSWFKHFESCIKYSNESRILVLHYEDLVGNLTAVVRKVAHFCGTSLDDQKLERTVERCGIEFMRRHNDKFDPRFANIPRNTSKFIRSGKPGDWLNELSPTLSNQLDDYLRKTINKIPLKYSAHMDRLTTSGNIIGMIDIPLSSNSGHRLLTESVREKAPHGLLMMGGEDGLKLGQSVRMRLRLAEKESIVIADAVVTWIGKRSEAEAVVFRFSHIDVADSKTLANFCEGAGQSLCESHPKLLRSMANDTL